MPWTRAVHLDHWADTEHASRNLPLLVRKLIRGTVSALKRLNIPANEQTSRPGFDGTVETTVGTEFVPAGVSIWEMGVNQDPPSKASKDAKRRFEQLTRQQRSETTFVFVTPRSWIKKDEWAKSLAQSQKWKDVIVHDSNSLEHWLELARDVDGWISTQTRNFPAGVQSLDDHWASLHRIAEHPLDAKVFTASRETEVDRIRDFLGRTPDSLYIQTHGLNDGIDFLAALVHQWQLEREPGDDGIEKQALVLLEHAVLVSDLPSWQQLCQSDAGLLLIPRPSLQISSTDVAGAVQSGHFVIVTGPRGIAPSDRSITLRRINQYELEKSLEGCGFSAAEAASIARSTAGSTSILKRRIASHPDMVMPTWASPEFAPKLAVLALIGGWSHVDPNPPPQQDVPAPFRYVPPADLAILELMGLERHFLDEVIARWKEPPEPLFLRFSDVVLVTSREDTWYLLGDYVTDTQLRQFADLAELVVLEDDPALELEPDKRWMANVLGKRHPLSTEFRRSVLETLVVIATCPTWSQSAPTNRVVSLVANVIRKVLPKGCGWQRWASLRSHFSILAEAAPDTFLQTVEADLDSESPSLRELFQTQTDQFMGGAMHTDLLWALEVLAWSPEYLKRVTVILVRLIQHSQIPANYGNRPENSLEEVYLLWLPQTNASIEDRLAGLDAVFRASPETGMKLLTKLLPGRSRMSSGTQMPRWRGWADGWSRKRARGEHYDYAMAFADFAFRHLGIDIAAWADALQGMLTFNEKITERTLIALNDVAEHYATAPDSAFPLWTALRDLIQRHEEFGDSDGAFSSDVLEKLRLVRDRLVPSDVVLRNQWLFENHTELPPPYSLRSIPYEEYDRLREQFRFKALEEVKTTAGNEGVWRLIRTCEDPSSVGWICGKYRLLNAAEARLPQCWAEGDEKPSRFAYAFASTSFHSAGGWRWIESLQPSSWTVEQQTALGQSLPFVEATWDWLASLSSEAENLYWSKKTGVFLDRNCSESVVRRVVAKLVDAKRPFTAIDVVHMRAEGLSSDLIAETLEAGLQCESIDGPKDVSYDVQELIRVLQETDFDQTRLARLEWGYLPFLERSTSRTSPLALLKMVLSEPALYVDMVRTVYRGKRETPDALADHPDAKFRATRSREFLDQLSRLPGQQENGQLDPAVLISWIKAAISLAAETGHDEITSHKIGQWLGRSFILHLYSSQFLEDISRVVEAAGDKDFMDGFVNGILNARGVTCRDPFEGGTQERELATKYSERAMAVRNLSTKLSQCFKIIQSHYEHYALREDEEAERRRLGK